MNTGTELQSWREAQHLTRAQFAALVGVSRRTVERWEREDRHYPARLVTLAIRGLVADGVIPAILNG
jgi:DNA-binding transcriptional regulator YiaG